VLPESNETAASYANCSKNLFKLLFHAQEAMKLQFRAARKQ
jgi:hypothetical protein